MRQVRRVGDASSRHPQESGQARPPSWVDVDSCAREYRKDDRDFQVHDCLVLQEYLPDKDTFTSFALSMRVTHVLRGGQFGVPEGYCVMSIEPWNMRAALEKEVSRG